MVSYSVLSSVAAIGYIFIFMIFMNAEKNKLITSFLTLLLSMISWTIGSLLMRIQFFPNYIFWYHISLFGLFFIQYSYFNFVSIFLDNFNELLSKVYKWGLLILFVINIPSGIVLKWPSIVETDNGISFVYNNYTILTGILVLFSIIINLNIIYIFYKKIKGNKKIRRQTYPLIGGLVILVLGNYLVLTPYFEGFPVDILAGVINIGILVHLLTEKRLLKPKMVTSNNIAYFFAMVLGFFVFYISYPYLNELIIPKGITIELINGDDSGKYTMYYLFYYAVISMIFYMFWYFMINKIGLNNEEFQNIVLRDYSSNIAKSLDLDTVIKHTLETVRYATGTSNMYIGIIEYGTGVCNVSYSDKLMKGDCYTFDKNNEFLSWVNSIEDFEDIKYFYNSSEYENIKEIEKKAFKKMEIDYVFPIKDNNDLKGVLLITNNNPKSKLLNKDFNLISSICTIASVALSEEQFRPLVSEMQLGLTLNELICNENGEPKDFRILSINKSYENMMNVKNEDIIGKSIKTVFPETTQDWLDKCGIVALTGKSTQINIYNKKIDKYFNTTIYSPKKLQFAVIFEDVTKQKKAEAKIEYMGSHDSLTGLYNRNYVDNKIEELNKKTDSVVSVIMGDVNKLKYINDNFGHHSGDLLLQKTANILKESARNSDIVARLGGDEFLIILENEDSISAKYVINRINKNLKGVTVENIPLTISLGHSTRKKDENINVEEIIKEADELMYENKIKSRKK